MNSGNHEYSHVKDTSLTHHRGTLKRRVFLLFGSFTLGLCMFYTALCLLVAYVIEDSIMYRLLEDEADYLRKQLQVEHRISQPRTEAMTLYMSHNGEFDFPSEIKEQLTTTPGATEIFTATNDTHYHLKFISFDNGQDGVLVANVTSYLVVTTISKNIVLPAGIIWGVVFFVSVLIAYRITVHAVAPIERLSAEVHSQQLLAKRDSEPPVNPILFTTSALDNEIGYLSRSLEQAFNQLSAALSRESHFTRDLSHEMRTPLTIIKNALTLIEQPSANKDEAILQIREASLTMDQTVEVLLALARKSALSQQSCDLRQLVEEGILQLYLTHPECDVELDLNTRLLVKANRRLITLLIRNLLENAARYSRNHQLRIFSQDNAIVFYNVVSQPLSDDPTAPGSKSDNSEGIGQGLYLVKRIVNTLGWQYHIIGDQDRYQFNLVPNLKD